MARCARADCGRWRPDQLARSGHTGVWFEGGWYCCAGCLALHAEVVLAQTHPLAAPDRPPAPRLGEWLVARQALQRSAVEAALQAQRTSGWRLGRHLVAMAALTGEQLLRALAAQAGTGYLAHVDPARVAHAPGGLSRAAVKALGVVPLEMSRDGERLAVAYAAPLPRKAIGAVREMTGALVVPLLVSDEDYQRLETAYGSSPSTRPGRAEAIEVSGLAAAAALIAAFAANKGTHRMQRVRLDPLLWVRLEGPEHREDLLVSLQQRPAEEAAWRVAPTWH